MHNSCNKNVLHTKVKKERERETKVMKRKKVVSLLAALSLVAVVGVGGTLAYLSDQTGTLKNEFTMSEEGIRIDLKESKVTQNADGNYIDADEGETVEANDINATSNTYSNLTPGAQMYKDPTVTVSANSSDCYVVVEVVNTDDNLNITDLGNNGNWELLTVNNAEEGHSYYVYKDVVEQTEQATKLAPVFTNVSLNTSTPADATLTPITIKAAAVQSEHRSETDAINAALELLTDGVTLQ